MGADTATPRVVDVLARVPLFQGLPRADLEGIAKLLKPKAAGAGEFVFREGDPGDRFYLVADGEVEILNERPLGDHEQVAIKRSGEALGEMSLLNHAPRSVSARAMADTRLLCGMRDDFDQLLGGESLAVRLLRGMARSLRAMDVRFGPREDPADDALAEFGRLVMDGLEPRAAPQVDGYQIAGATVRDASQSGGSLWEGFAHGDGRALLSVMDVKGTGLPPAYLIAISRTLLRELAPAVDFSQLMPRLNAATFANLFGGLDECVETALVDVGPEGLRWTCAGDQPAVILRRDGTTEDVTAQGPPLGILPHFDYGVSELELSAGDTLVAFSEAPAGIIRGAIDLIRERADADMPELARLLRTALGKIRQRGAPPELAFVLVRRT